MKDTRAAGLHWIQNEAPSIQDISPMYPGYGDGDGYPWVSIFFVNGDLSLQGAATVYKKICVGHITLQSLHVGVSCTGLLTTRVHHHSQMTPGMSHSMHSYNIYLYYDYVQLVKQSRENNVRHFLLVETEVALVTL